MADESQYMVNGVVVFEEAEDTYMVNGVTVTESVAAAPAGTILPFIMQYAG